MRRLLTFTMILFLMAAPVRAQDFLGKNAMVWTKELERPEESARRNAAYALGKLGFDAQSAVPALIKHLGNDDSPKVRETAAFALGEIGRDSTNAALNEKLVPPLTAALKNGNHLVRRSAAYGLGSLGKDAEPAREALAAALDDAQPEVRQNVAWALGKIGVAGLPGLRKALADGDSLVKRDAAAALTPLDPTKTRAALNELLPLCLENNSEVRKAALIVLVKIVGPEDTAALAPIRQALVDADAEVRANAALALSNIGGKDAVAAVPVLLDALRRGDLALRRQAAAALRNIGPEAKDAVPELIQALRDPDVEIRENAALALGGIGANAEAAIPALVRVVADSNEKNQPRIEAAVALQGIGPVPAAVKVVPTLLQVLQDSANDDKVRERIMWSLRIHKADLQTMPGVYPAFTKVLSEPRSETNRLLRYDCAYMLGVLQGPDVPPLVMQVLLDYLKDDTILIFDNKKSSVGASGQEVSSGKADVKDVGKGDGRTMVIQALGRIGPARLAKRSDIVQQLRLLAKDDATNAKLREGCEKLLKGLK